MCGNFELKPGPKKRNSCYIFSICYWILNSIAAHNFETVDLLNPESKSISNIFRLSESYLDSSILSNNESLSTKRYELARNDHPDDVKRGSNICAYIKETWPVRRL